MAKSRTHNDGCLVSLLEVLLGAFILFAPAYCVSSCVTSQMDIPNKFESASPEEIAKDHEKRRRYAEREREQLEKFELRHYGRTLTDAERRKRGYDV